jgi:hypothetical protein
MSQQVKAQRAKAQLVTVQQVISQQALYLIQAFLKVEVKLYRLSQVNLCLGTTPLVLLGMVCSLVALMFV